MAVPLLYQWVQLFELYVCDPVSSCLTLIKTE